MRTPQLFIMVKEPRAGRVKTRLGKGIGMTRAAWWFRHQTRRLLRVLGRDVRWQTVLAVSPDVEGLQSRIWPDHLPRWPQGRGDLGQRMAAIFRHAPSGPVVIIGADIPGITPALIAKAFRALGDHDAVFGPAYDGGYWLVGLKRGAGAVPVHLFENVRWS
ncbi:MAG: glycosyltransferase, partial [Proteobacteria bacterium]|nr:glycosyltransferase [Pseudomonadota bacterium]